MALGSGPRLREWLAFALISLLPTAAVSILAVRALRGEEAAVRREMQLQLDQAAQTVEDGWQQALLALNEPRWGAPPAVAEPVTWAPDTSHPGDRTTEGRCTQLHRRLGQDRSARAELLASCADHRTEGGRFSWPLAALAPDAATPATTIGAWLESHNAWLAAVERAAIRLEIDRASWLSLDDRAQLDRLVAAPAGAEARALAMEHAPAAVLHERVAWDDARSRGRLRRQGDRYEGMVVHPRSIESALAHGWLALPPGIDVRLVYGPESPPLGVEVLPGGAHLVVAWTDPRAIERATARSRWLLVGGAVAAGLLAVLLAAGLWWRVRSERRLSALRTDYVAAVSHELRTPLSSIRMLAELLEANAVDEAERDEVHAGLAREARRLGDTVERLLRFSRLESGRTDLRRKHVDLRHVLDEAATRFAERFPDGAEVVVDAPTGLDAFVDPDGVATMIDNLLHNAHKYAPRGGPYQLRGRRRRGHVEIEVADHGPGIHRRHHRRIFRAFERADDRLSEATDGTGIGLSLVRHIATHHGGRIELHSAPGEGARFRITLPSPAP